ncbi:MFS transporter [Nocardioides insulae]|uniref:MFS transporter n=1 Tax=Nocardioides insulae TaxID=394734 RepID=UPI00040F4D70|nr:MFS transporter [Nocardioides insulae]
MTAEPTPLTPTSTDEPPGWRRNIVLFLGGQTVSLLGSMLVQYAVMWHLTIQTQSGSVLMWSIVFGMLPQAFVSIFGGVWADRHHRKLLAMGADTAIALATLVLALLMVSGVDDLWIIYAALAVRSTFAGIQTPAVSAMLPQIVPQRVLLRVNGLNQSIQSGMMLLAPALAAAIYASLSITAVFFVDVVTALIGVGLLFLVPVPRPPRPQGEVAAAGYFADLVGGFRYLASHASVRWVVGLMAVVMVLLGAPSYLSPLVITREFGTEVWKLTVNEVCWSAGMLGGGLALAIWGGRVTQRITLVIATMVASGLFTVGLGLAEGLWAFFAFGLLIGITFAPLTSTTMTILQESVEPEMLGRVFGFVGIVMTVAMPLSMVVFGPLADEVDVRLLLVVAGLLLLLAIAAILASPSARRSLAAVSRPDPDADQTRA